MSHLDEALQVWDYLSISRHGELAMTQSKTLIRVCTIEQRIIQVRGEKVILDADLAGPYGVSTKRLNEQVKRNSPRFPADFAFRLTRQEKEEVVANCDRLGKIRFSSTLPRVFTEHGAIMAACVLNSRRAVEVSVFVVRAFVQLRVMVEAHAELAGKILQLERHLAGHDAQITALLDAMKRLMRPAPVSSNRRIGFRGEDP